LVFNMSDLFRKVRNSLGELITAVYEKVEAHDKFYLILMQLGWPPVTNRGQYVEEFSRIVEEYERNGLDHVRDTVESAMIRWHDKTYLRQMLHEWVKSPLLQARSHILTAAVQAHLRGEYILAIPVMLSQIEGVVVSGLGISGQVNSKKFKSHIESLLHEGMIIKNKNETIRQFVIGKLMAPFLHGEPVRASPSRHAILHGADLNYGTEPNSLKVILFMENIRQLFRFETINGGRVFHVYGCPSLRSSKKNRIFFSNVMEAMRLGLRACRRCGANKYLW